MKAIRNPKNSIPALLALVAVLGSGLAFAADSPRPFPDPMGKHEPKLRDKPAHHTHEKRNHDRQPGKAVPASVVGTISTRTPSCAKGFKATKVGKRGYTCVMPVKPRCDYGKAWPPTWNAATRRIEYVCVLPEG